MNKLLDSLLETGLREGCFPGAAAACGCGDEVYAISCVGKIADGQSDVDERTRYDMASLTKVLAPTMLAFQAIESGRLTLWDTLATWFENVPEDKKEITVFRLMTHTAGFEPSFRLDQTVEKPEDALRAILDSKLICKVGEAPNYSCMGYIVLGKLLEKLYGEGLDTLARKRVFEPLSMYDTSYNPKGDNIAATEIDAATGRAWQGIVHDENARFLRGVSANAGVFSNIGDMIRFCRMLSKNGDGFVSPALMKKATANYTPGFDVHRGLGFHLAGTEYNYMGDLFPECSFGHTGFTGTSVAVDPTTGFWAVLLSNRVHPTRENLKLMPFRRRLHNALYAAFSKSTIGR